MPQIFTPPFSSAFRPDPVPKAADLDADTDRASRPAEPAKQASSPSTPLPTLENQSPKPAASTLARLTARPSKEQLDATVQTEGSSPLPSDDVIAPALPPLLQDSGTKLPLSRAPEDVPLPESPVMPANELPPATVKDAATPVLVPQEEIRPPESPVIPESELPPAPAKPPSVHEVKVAHVEAPPKTIPVKPASTLPSATPGPVFNQDGSLHPAHLRHFIARLVEQVPALPDNAPASLVNRRDRLIAHLAQIPAGIGDDIPATANQLLALRDGFAAAAADARKLASHFRGHRVPRHPDANAAQLYGCLAANLTELKRIHLTAAAPAVMQDYARREVANLKEKVPTIDTMTASNISRDAGAALAYDFGAASLELGGASNRTLWFDDDRDLNYYTGNSVSAKVGVLADLLGLKTGGTAGGTYYETEKLGDMVQLIASRDANRSFPARSAGPAARQTAAGWQNLYGVLAKNAAAQVYKEAPGAPLYLNDKKLAKGANTEKLRQLGAEFDNLRSAASSDSFAALLHTAYPTTAERLKGEADDIGEGVFREPLAAAVPTSDPLGYGRAPYRSYDYLTVSSGIGKDHTMSPGADIGGHLSGSVGGYTYQFHMQNPEASHSLLDPTYHADMASSMKLVAQLDALQDDSARPPAKLSLYHATRDRLQHASATPLPPADQRYYGPDHNIPAQFRDSMTNTDVAQLGTRLADIDTECGTLRTTYLDFVEHAAKFSAKPDKYTPAPLKATLRAAREEAFNAINRAVWGAKSDGTGGYPGGFGAASKNPKKFLAQSHDAIGMALGCTGTHLAVLKRRLSQLLEGSGDVAEKNRIKTVIQQSDETYLRTRNLLDKAYLPMTKTETHRAKPTFEAVTISQRHNLFIKASAGTLFSFNFGEMIAHRAGKSMGDYSVSNEAGNVSLMAQCRYQYANKQVNPNRMGHYLEFKIAASGGTVTGPLVVEAVMHALKKLHPDADTAEQAHSLREQLQGLALDTNAGAGVIFRLRRFPDAGHKRFDLQYMRVFQSKTGGPSIGVPIPTPVGLFKAKWSKQVSLQNVVYERLGPDLGYLILQNKKLTAVIGTAKANAERLGVDENDVLKAQFTNTFDDGLAGFEGERNAKSIADSYFSNSSLIPTIIDRYMAYATAAGNAERDGTSLANAPAASEFYRFFERDTKDEPFRRVAETAAEARHYAPGSTVNWTDKANEETGTPHDPFALPANLLGRVPMPALPSGRSWEEEKAHIAGLSFRERIDYYCSGQGRPLLDTFINAIESVKQVHNVSRYHARDSAYGFQTRLQDTRERRQADTVLRDKEQASRQTGEEPQSGNVARRIWRQLRRYGLRQS